MENYEAFVKQNLTLVGHGSCIFLHSLQHACLPTDMQICTDPENLILSIGIRLSPGQLDWSGTFPSTAKFAHFPSELKVIHGPNNLFV